MRHDYLSKTEQDMVAKALKKMQAFGFDEYRDLATRFEQADHVTIVKPGRAR